MVLNQSAHVFALAYFLMLFSFGCEDKIVPGNVTILINHMLVVVGGGVLLDVVGGGMKDKLKTSICDFP